MGKRTIAFKKARTEAMATIREQLSKDKDAVAAVAALQKESLEVFTKESKEALDRFTEKTNDVLSKCDELTKYLDARMAKLDDEIAFINNEPLTEEHFEGEYNTLREQVEGMYASVRMFQSPMEKSNEAESTIGETAPEAGEAKEEVVAEPVVEEPETLEPIEDEDIMLEPAASVSEEKAPEYVTEDAFTINTEDEATDEYDSMYDDIIEPKPAEEIPASDEVKEDAPVITVVESSTADTPVQDTQDAAPTSLEALLSRARDIRI